MGDDLSSTPEEQTIPVAEEKSEEKPIRNTSESILTPPSEQESVESPSATQSPPLPDVHSENPSEQVQVETTKTEEPKKRTEIRIRVE